MSKGLKIAEKIIYVVAALLLAAYVINWFVTQYSPPRVDDNQFGGLIAPQMDELQTAGPYQNPVGCAGCPVAGSSVLGASAMVDDGWVNAYTEGVVA